MVSLDLSERGIVMKATSDYAPTSEPVPVLREDRLYLGDNGRCFCGRLRCAGMTAHFTGHDRSGQPVRLVTDAEQREARRMGVVLACEGCPQ